VSQENVEVVRESLDAYSRRDIEAARRLHHPDVELDWSASRSALARVYRGVDDAERFWAEYYETFEETNVEAERFIDLGETVVVPNVAYQRGRDGIVVSARSTLVYTVRDHKIARICLYQQEDEALKALGLQN
jgi:ketosteroid isomerase-like protein